MITIESLTEGKCSTFNKIFYEWIEKKKFSVKESTIANYRFKWNKHIKPIFGMCLMSEVTTNDIFDFINEKISGGLSVKYVNDIIILMKAIYKYAELFYSINNKMTYIRPLKDTPSVIKLLSNEQISIMIKYLFSNLNNVNLGIIIACFTGIRIGELCALKWGDINIEDSSLKIYKTIQRVECFGENSKTKLIITSPKSYSSIRLIPIPDILMKKIKILSGNSDEYICSGQKKPMEPRTLQYKFRKVLKDLDLPFVHFHSLRHCMASKCIRLGFDVKSLSEILGHSDVNITLNRYVHSNFSQKQNLMNKLEF